MKIENLLVVVGLIQVSTMSHWYWNSDQSILEINVHDTFYIIHIAFVQLFCLLLIIVDFLIYKRIRARVGKVNTGWAVMQIVILIAFLLLVGVLWKELQNGIFPQIQIFSLAILFVLSQLLLTVHFFLPRRKRKSPKLRS